MLGRENAGISSERGARNSSVESLRFPGEGSSAQGKSGPKPRLKSVGDGHSVDIPKPSDNKEAGKQKDSQTMGMESHGQAQRLRRSEVRVSLRLVRDAERTREAKLMNSRWREKLLTY